MAPHALLLVVPWLCCLIVMEMGPPAKPAGESRPAAARAVSRRAATALMRFLEPEPEALRSYAGARRLTARNDRFGQEAWMTVQARLDERGFRYEVIAEGGSAFLRRRVLRAALDAERELAAHGGLARAAFTPANYHFAVAADDGQTVRLAMMPRQSEPFLIDGEILIDPETGELGTVSGRLARNPSFWTTRVDVVRRYARIGGIRLPVSVESIASVRVAGRSVFTMSFEYTSINGRPLGAPDA